MVTLYEWKMGMENGMENGDALRNNFASNHLQRNSPCFADPLAWAAPLPGRRPSLLLQHLSPKVIVANGPVIPPHRLLIGVLVHQKRPPQLLPANCVLRQG